jgi:YggT family protein
MKDAGLFLVETFFSLLFFVFLLRLLLQWARADFRNPLSQAVVKLSNWLIMPLRRVLPPVGRIDTASVVAVLAIAFTQIGVISALFLGGLPEPLDWLRLAAVEVIRSILWLYFWAIFIYALLSMLAPDNYSPVHGILHSLCEPMLGPIRRTLPSIGGLDLSPMWALIAIQVLLILLRGA